VTGRSEDDVWRSIVENYGERPDVDLPAPDDEHVLDPEPEPDDVDAEADADADARFVPPPPPPLPHPPPVRLAAWIGVFGSPAVLLLATILGIALPTWLGYALIGYFLAGFGYLVLHMERGPRDPWDDGARL
jgi:hypothetical protein